MKKKYKKPAINSKAIEIIDLLQASAAYTDDPKKPEDALSRSNYTWGNLWDEDSE